MAKFLEFGSKGCAFCQAQKKAKVMERLAAEFPGVEFERIDADKREDLADDYEVRGLPCYVLLDDEDEELARKEGGVPFATLQKFIAKAMAKGLPTEKASDE